MTDDFFETTFRSSVDAPAPDAAFVADLRKRIEAQWSGEPQEDIPVTTMIERPAPEAPEADKPRRPWLKYAAAAAAAVVIGGGALVLADSEGPSTDVANPPETTIPDTPPEPEIAGKITTTVALQPGDMALGLTATDAGLFYTANGEVVSVDPATGAVIERLRVADVNVADRRPLEDELVAFGDRLFVGVHGVGIIEVDPSNGLSVVRRYDVANMGGKLSVHVVVTDVAIFTTLREGKEIVRIDRATGTNTAVPLAEGETLHTLTSDGDALLATFFLGIGNDVLRRLDPATLKATDEVELTVGSTRALLLHDGALFVTGDREANGQGSVVKVDPAAMSVISSTPIPGAYPQYLSVAGDTVWVGNFGGQQLAGVDAGTNELTKVIAIEKNAYRIAALPGGDVMWGWDEERNHLFRIEFDG